MKIRIKFLNLNLLDTEKELTRKREFENSFPCEFHFRELNL